MDSSPPLRHLGDPLEERCFLFLLGSVVAERGFSASAASRKDIRDWTKRNLLRRLSDPFFGGTISF